MSNLSSVSGGPSLSSDSKPLPPALLVPQSSSSEQQPQAQQQQQQTTAGKRKRSLPGTPDPDAEVIALSPRTLLTTNRFVCEICNKGFQRDQNLQLHRRGHNLPWKLKQRSGKDIRKRVYICPETSCVHHDPARALGDLTGVKKHFCRKHGEKKWKCEKCSKRYAVQSDWKAHSKTCGTREYRCDCGTLFSRRDSFITHRAFCDALAEESVRASVGSIALPHMPAGIPTAPSGSVLLGHGSTVLQHHHHHQHHHNQQQQQASASSLSLYRTTAGGGAGIFRTGPAQQFPFSVRSSNCVPPVRPHLSLWPETPEDQQQQQHIPNAAGFFTATKPGMLAGLHDYEEPCKSMVNMMPSSCSSTHNSNNTSSNNNNTNNGTGGGGGGGGATVSAGHSLYSNILNSVVLNSSSDTDFGAVANWPDRPPAASASRLSLSNSSASTDNYNNNNNNSSSNNSNNTNSNATNNMDSLYSNMNVNLYANMSGLPQMSATALLQKAAQMGATASNTGNAAAFGMAGSENAAAGAGGGHVSLALAGPASTSQQQHHHHHHNPFSLLSSDHQHQQHQQQQQGLKISENAAAELMMSSMFNNLSDTGALNKLMMNMAAAAGSSSSAAAMAEQERLTRDFLGVGGPFMPPPPGSHMDHFVMYSRDSNTGHAPAAVAAAAAAAKSSMKTTATATSPSTSWDATA